VPENNSHATLYDFRDLDLLLKMESTRQDWDSETLAHALGQPENTRGVGSRLAWMRRFGMLDRTETGLWTLTDGARRVTEARLRAAHARELDQLPEEQMIEVMAHIAGRYLRADPMTAIMLRREFAFGTRRR